MKRSFSVGRFAKRRVIAMRRFVRKRRIVTALVALVVLAGAAYGVKWAWGKVENRRSLAMVQMAQGYLKEGKATEARMCLETALRLQPAQASALQTLARLQTQTGEAAAALQTWQKLAETGKITLPDLSIYASLAITQGDRALAERLANAVAAGGGGALSHRLKAELLLKQDNVAGAEEELRKAVAADATMDSKAALMNFLLERRWNAETSPEIQSLIGEMIDREDTLGLQALLTAISRGFVPADQLPARVEALRRHPAASERGRLVADSLAVRLNPSIKPSVVQNLVARNQNAPLEERTLALAWLLENAAPAEGVHLITREEALTNARSFLVWIDALSAAGDRGRVLEILDAENLPVSKTTRRLFRGRTLAFSGRQPEADAEFQSAFDESRVQGGDVFLETLSYLNLAGRQDLFEEGAAIALEDPSKAVSSFRRLLPSVMTARDASRTRRIYAIAARSPALSQDLTLQNDISFLDLLLGNPVDPREIAFRSEANPRDFSLRATHALAQLKAGRAKDALQTLEDCEPDVHVATLPPHHKAIVACALAANGKRQEALSIMGTVPPTGLSVQEVAFVQSFLTEPSPTPSPTPAETPKKKAPKKK